MIRSQFPCLCDSIQSVGGLSRETSQFATRCRNERICRRRIIAMSSAMRIRIGTGLPGRALKKNDTEAAWGYSTEQISAYRPGPIKRATIAILHAPFFDAATSARVVDMNNFSSPKRASVFLAVQDCVTLLSRCKNATVHGGNTSVRL